jgi:hypothetical protein
MSSTSNSPPLNPEQEETCQSLKDTEKTADNVQPRDVSFNYGDGEDLLSLQDVDPALNAKMHIVNNVSSSTTCTSQSGSSNTNYPTDTFV